MRKLAELFGDVQVQTVVGLVLPQRRNAVGFLQNQARDSLQLQARSGGQARRSSTHHDGPVPERRRRRRRKSSCSRLRLAAAAESEIVSGFAHVLLLGAECLSCVGGIRRHFCCCCCSLSFRTSFLTLSADQSLLASSTSSSCNVGCEEFSSLSTPFAMGINDKRKCSTLDTWRKLKNTTEWVKSCYPSSLQHSFKKRLELVTCSTQKERERGRDWWEKKNSEETVLLFFNIGLNLGWRQ